MQLYHSSLLYLFPVSHCCSIVPVMHFLFLLYSLSLTNKMALHSDSLCCICLLHMKQLGPFRSLAVCCSSGEVLPKRRPALRSNKMVFFSWRRPQACPLGYTNRQAETMGWKYWHKLPGFIPCRAL